VALKLINIDHATTTRTALKVGDIRRCFSLTNHPNPLIAPFEMAAHGNERCMG
jgi:hypothetical protein